MQVMVKSDESDVGGVEHQFNGHQNPQNIAACQNAVDPDAENDSRKRQAMIEGHDGRSCPKRTAPTNAARSIKETASNGNTISPSSNRPNEADVGVISAALTGWLKKARKPRTRLRAIVKAISPPASH